MQTKPGSRSFCLALLAAAGCLLLVAPAEAAAGAGTDPDVGSTLGSLNPIAAADQIKLAEDYLAGNGVERNAKKAAYWYEKAAGTGNPVAQFEIGYLYATGIGVGRNAERAAHWYQLAASNGLPLAKVNLAVAYLWGTGVKKDEGLAFELLNEAAIQGSGLAACYLGDIYAFGMGVAQDSAKAEYWYRSGARLQDPIAEYDLALMLMNERGTQDISIAAKLFRESAAAGYVAAKHQLGLLLVRNPALAASPLEAVDLLNEAAAAGNWRSSVLLGVLARDGITVRADQEAAYFHFRVAVLQGGDGAKHLVAHDLELLTAKLGRERIEAMDAQASAWFEAHPFELTFVERKDGESERGFVVTAPDPAHVAELMRPPGR
jgi:uncharacterized protein